MRYLHDHIKMILNLLQDRLVSEDKSDNVLLVFDSEKQLVQYKKEHKDICPIEILITMHDLCNTNSLTRMKINRYWFMTSEEIEERRNEE